MGQLEETLDLWLLRKIASCYGHAGSWKEGVTAGYWYSPMGYVCRATVPWAISLVHGLSHVGLGWYLSTFHFIDGIKSDGGWNGSSISSLVRIPKRSAMCCEHREELNWPALAYSTAQVYMYARETCGLIFIFFRSILSVGFSGGIQPLDWTAGLYCSIRAQ